MRGRTCMHACVCVCKFVCVNVYRVGGPAFLCCIIRFNQLSLTLRYEIVANEGSIYDSYYNCVSMKHVYVVPGHLRLVGYGFQLKNYKILAVGLSHESNFPN